MIMTKTSAAGIEVKDSGLTLNVKAVGDDGVIEGYASVWDVVDSYNEAVMPGAFKTSLANSARTGRSVKMLYQHDTYLPIGVWNDLQEDSKGLFVRGRILKDASQKALEAYNLVRDGALDELSIGYRTIESKKDPTRPGVILLKQLDLREISIVTFGALARAAHIEAVKSILEGGKLPSVREFEEFLRDAGFSKSLATALASKAAPHLRGDPDGQADDALAFLTALRA